jgi:hypothetical protein
MTEQNHDNTGDTVPPNSPPHINLKVKDHSSEVFFKVKKTMRLEKVMRAFCERQGKVFDSTRFVFDGTKLAQDQTPADLDMEDGDIIDVFEEQIGGA